MVRLMGWMVGLLITSCSTVFAFKNNTNSTKNKNGKNDDDKFYDSLEDFKANAAFQHPWQFEINCTMPSIGDFPPDFLTQEQRSKGGLIVHFALGMYACYALAAVCDTFFVPSLHLISDRLGLSSDVAGATFMAAGTSAPELFESLIGAFITEGDIGVGTIVGSAVFNILAVTSVCGILTGMVVPLDWWPLTRDCVFYAFTVIALIFIIEDERIYWYESTVLLVMFVLYVFLMYFNPKLASLFNSGTDSRTVHDTEVQNGGAIAIVSGPRIMENNLVRQTAIAIADGTLSAAALNDKNKVHINNEDNREACSVLLNEALSKIQIEEEEEDEWHPLKVPDDGCIQQLIYVITWPVNCIFYLTVPNCNKKRWRAYYPLTFFMSVLYIGSLSYFVAWMVTIFGFTIGVPDTVMGITFLAIGTSVPEGYSSVIVCRKGLGNMAISNSVGSNVFDILFCLGLPWLVKALAFSSDGYVQVNSQGLVYSSMSLLATVILLYVVIVLCQFQLDIRVGVTCLILYSAFLTFASLVELNVLGNFNPPLCA